MMHNASSLRFLLAKTGGLNMQDKKGAIDRAKLLGFANLPDERGTAFDFKNKTSDARLGAKVGDGEFSCSAADLREMGVILPSERSKKD